jgi:tetratricopeptide (TPR) repeat protein
MAVARLAGVASRADSAPDARRENMMITSSRVLAFTLAAILAFSASGAAIVAGPSAGSSGSGPSMPSGKQIDAQKRYADGVAALQAAKYKDAASAFQDVLSVSPKNGQVAFMLGVAQVGLEDWRNAQKSLTSAVKFAPDLPDAKSWLGAVDVKLGDAKKAAEQRTALQAMKDKCAGACADAAKIDAGLKRIDDVTANPAMKFSARETGVQLATAEQGGGAYLAAYGLINEGKYESALGLLRTASLAAGPSADVLTYQGFASRKLGRYDAAVSYYASALDLAPDHRGANEYLGEYYVQIGDIGQAKAQLAKLEGICRFGCPEAEELRAWIMRGHA